MVSKGKTSIYICHLSISYICRNNNTLFLYINRKWRIVIQIQQYLYKRIFLSSIGTSHSHFTEINMQLSFIYKDNTTNFNSYFSIVGYCRE